MSETIPARYYAVVVPDGELPEIAEAASPEDLAALLSGVAEMSGAYIYAFRGERLGLTRGGRWLVVDGRRLSLLPPEDPAMVEIDDSGAVGLQVGSLGEILPSVFANSYRETTHEDDDEGGTEGGYEDDEDAEGAEGGTEGLPGRDAGGW